MKFVTVLLGILIVGLITLLVVQLERNSELYKFSVEDRQRLIEAQEEIDDLKHDRARLSDENLSLKYLQKYGDEVVVGKPVKFRCEGFVCKAEGDVEMDGTIKINDDKTKLVTFDGQYEYPQVDLEVGFDEIYISSWNEYGIVVSLKYFDRGVGLIDTYYLGWDSGFSEQQLERCQWSIRRGDSLREIDWCKQVSLTEKSNYVELDSKDGSLF